MRGGTSKSLVFHANDLPVDAESRDRVILRAFGSPDARQIDGLGGADPLTSKLAIVSSSNRDDAEIDYTFGQVGILAPTINYKVNCGNTAAAVGVYAVEEGIVPTEEGVTSVRIFSTNSKRYIVAEVPTIDGAVSADRNFAISGVPGLGAEIRLTFLEPSGGVTSVLLPTGACVNEVETENGRRVQLSVVDCGNLYAFISAQTWSLDGSESPAEIEAHPRLKREVEEIREVVCRDLLGGSPSSVGVTDSAKLKVAIVGYPATYASADGALLRSDDMDIVARVINQERVHKAFAVTGAISLAAAASIPGTIVNSIAPLEHGIECSLRIGHPQGVIVPAMRTSNRGGEVLIEWARISRTARRIMDGYVYVPAAG